MVMDQTAQQFSHLTKAWFHNVCQVSEKENVFVSTCFYLLFSVEPDRNKAFKVDLIFEKKNSFMVGETLPGLFHLLKLLTK